ncbi:hypothetical protein LFX25_19900 [Leptospira sp. FAT2]|uniref:DUF6998 domain-containing protein n=1 Tax=Leptospira sanjuanensis TaxID=2879643 RepID=UPI001EE98E0D|nr:hypothetical protein [Leptospira sanjuanensis]MCG6195508.1 hypothetical protein [Leptospira sanjuanensis]
MDNLPNQIIALKKIVRSLQIDHPGKKFTLDGILIGSIGEVYAEYKYGLTPLKSGTKTHDCQKGNKLVQVKTTQRKSIVIAHKPKHLIVLKLEDNGEFHEIYNGKGVRVWDLIKNRKIPKYGYYSISINQLSKIMLQVPLKEKIKEVK